MIRLPLRFCGDGKSEAMSGWSLFGSDHSNREKSRCHGGNFRRRQFHVFEGKSLGSGIFKTNIMFAAARRI